MAYNSFPYVSMHELNLDYLLNKSKEVQSNVEAAAGSASAAASSAAASANSAEASLTYSRNSANSAAASEASAADSANSARIAAAAAGDPVTFTASAQLTNTNKIYVYIGETGTYTYGHWYYYSGSAWVDGGVYGTWTTDDTLTLAGVAADAKATGDAINNLENEFTERVRNELTVNDMSTWSNTRVGSDGILVNSPSQLTTDEILNIGKGNILKFEIDTFGTNLSISYYQKTDSGTFTYLESFIVSLRKIKYVYCKYDYCRISLVRSSANPPLLSETTITRLLCFNSEFYEKNISFLGDSITTFSGISEGGYNPIYYPTSDVEYFEQTYEKMFYDACGGANLSVSAISNSSWRNQNNVSCPSAYVDTRITRLSVNGVPDYVVINMGTNDPYSVNIGNDIEYTYDVSTLEENVVYSSYAIQTTIRKIQTSYPNCKIILLIPKFPSAIGNENYTFERWERLCDYMIQIANMYGVYKIVDLRKCGITHETFSTDCIESGMHPNFTGMKKMSSYMISELLLH